MPIEQKQLDELRDDFNREIREHEHDGNQATQVKDFDIFGELPSRLNTEAQTIATTGNIDWYVIAPISGRLESIDFSGIDVLAVSDTNYITWTITNLERDGAGSTVMLAATDVNTTKSTGGTAIAANTVRELLMSNASNTGVVVAGDRLRIRAAVTNTLANTVTNSVYLLRFR